MGQFILHFGYAFKQRKARNSQKEKLQSNYQHIEDVRFRVFCVFRC